MSSRADLHRRDRALGHSVDPIGHHLAVCRHIHALASRLDQVDGIYCTRQDCRVSSRAAECHLFQDTDAYVAR